MRFHRQNESGTEKPHVSKKRETWGTHYYLIFRPPGCSGCKLQTWATRQSKDDWNERIAAHRPPPQKPNSLQILQDINNLMMGMVPYKAPIARGLDGKVHNIPDHIPDDWTHEDLELAKGELEESIKARNGEANKLGEDGPHREQIRKEEHLLRQVNKKLSGS